MYLLHRDQQRDRRHQPDCLAARTSCTVQDRFSLQRERRQHRRARHRSLLVPLYGPAFACIDPRLSSGALGSFNDDTRIGDPREPVQTELDPGNSGLESLPQKRSIECDPSSLRPLAPSIPCLGETIDGQAKLSTVCIGSDGAHPANLMPLTCAPSAPVSRVIVRLFAGRGRPQ